MHCSHSSGGIPGVRSFLFHNVNDHPFYSSPSQWHSVYFCFSLFFSGLLLPPCAYDFTRYDFTRCGSHVLFWFCVAIGVSGGRGGMMLQWWRKQQQQEQEQQKDEASLGRIWAMIGRKKETHWAWTVIAASDWVSAQLSIHTARRAAHFAGRYSTYLDWLLPPAKHSIQFIQPVSSPPPPSTAASALRPQSTDLKAPLFLALGKSFKLFQNFFSSFFRSELTFLLGQMKTLTTVGFLFKTHGVFYGRRGNCQP